MYRGFTLVLYGIKLMMVEGLDPKKQASIDPSKQPLFFLLFDPEKGGVLGCKGFRAFRLVGRLRDSGNLRKGRRRTGIAWVGDLELGILGLWLRF